MLISDFDFDLPEHLIATEPASSRDRSRLLVLDKDKGRIEHRHFFDIGEYLQSGDVLILNNTKVLPARLWAAKESGGKMEVILHRRLSGDSNGEIWQVLIGGRGAKIGRLLYFENGLEGELINNNEDSTWDIRFNRSGPDLMRIIEKIGETPLPPYIRSARATRNVQRITRSDREDYQTVYADSSKLGSAAAPTAGLHFTRQLLAALEKKGVLCRFVTLQVGLGTFAPIKTAAVEEHRMHSELIELPADTLADIRRAKREGRRVIAVGTTSLRTLESFAPKIMDPDRDEADLSKWTDIFIYPGYEFRIVDALITNFHLPRSSLILLVSALAGTENIRQAYQEAIRKEYRFFSYGDAMLICG